MKKRNINTKTIALYITIITCCCKFLGFLKNSLLAYYFGTSPVVDAYVMTFSIGTITSGWIAGLIGNFTPVFKKIDSIESREHALRFSSNIHNLIFILVLLLVVILECFADKIVNIVAPGFKGEVFEYTVYFFRIYLISVVFYAIYRFSQEFLNCNQDHLHAMLPELLMSSCCIVSIIVSSKIGNTFLIFGYVISVVLQAICGQISCYKNGFRHRRILKWDNYLKDMLIMAIPIFLSNTLAEINVLVDKIFASSLEEGIVSSLDYANTMKDFVFQIGTIAMVTMIFPIISKYWAETKTEKFVESILNGISMLTVLYIPVIVGIALTGDLAINIVFKRGQFSEAAAVVTTNAFIIYSIGIFALIYRSVFFKAFYSMQKTKYVLLISLVNVTINIVLNFLLVKKYGYFGLTIATSASGIISLPLYFILFYKSVKHVSYRSFFNIVIKSTIATIIMSVVLILIRRVINFDNNTLSQILLLLLLIITGATVYFVICLFLRVDEAIRIKEILKRKLMGMKENNKSKE